MRNKVLYSCAALFVFFAWFARAEDSQDRISIQDEAQIKPKIALVIDDFGLTYPKDVPDEDWMKLPFPMTFADMPKSPRTGKAAEMTKKAGKELIIHFPF